MFLEIYSSLDTENTRFWYAISYLSDIISIFPAGSTSQPLNMDVAQD